LSAGENLRRYRESLGLTIRDVEAASTRLARKYDNPDMVVSLSRLSDIETKEIVPSVYKLYALAAVYRLALAEILKLYGIDAEMLSSDFEVATIARTHRVSSLNDLKIATIPTKVDPGFQISLTSVVGRFVQAWGTIPLAFLRRFTTRAFSYGFIGLEDWTMYPLLLPGTFIQIDESRTKVTEGIWNSEFARPIYFVETREGLSCSWCEVNAGNIVLRPHPMSPAKTRSLKLGSEAEVIGQVVGLAMRLDGWQDPSAEGSRGSLQ
jgi:transcriptional regulator with XRE-family HTH domain